MGSINVTELRPGNYFIDEGMLLTVLDILLNKTAMRKMVAKVKVKNLRTGSVTEISRNSGYTVELVKLDKKQMQYLYDAGDDLVFMDPSTYEQIEISKTRLTWELNFLKPESMIDITSYEDEILGISLPAKVALKIVETDNAIAGNTVQKAMKNATLETGYQVKIPMFIENGEVIMVRTDDGTYDGRAQGEK
ncbi:MAG: elongation factor P [Erysipelotrichaceae bacterium]|jgi:elongation factor P|nr:elongation factor P [Erysipelotrichaceae bacterium]